VGGSLGARSINEALDKDLELFEQNGLQLIWQTGRPYATKAKERVSGRSGVWVNDFITQMEYAYAAADMVISRAGAMAIAELCVVQKPVVFVPYPFAAEDHQTVNAMNLVQKGAALMVKDSEAGEKVVPTIIELSKDENKQRELKEHIGQQKVTNADARVAEEVLKSI
jgi:UDP-N-acetylglucosamine--N-acetylmuramyl-(pentapeptide) pyrophosphoryl-undecaprenol N-acetylglucosamine transferase